MWPNNLIFLSAKKTNPILSNTHLFVSLFTNDTLSNLVIASALLPDPSPAASSFPVHYVLHLMLIRDLGLDKTFHLFYFLFICNEVLFRFAAFEHRHDMCHLCDSMFWDLFDPFEQGQQLVVTCAQQGCVIGTSQIGVFSASDCNTVMVFLHYTQHDAFRIKCCTALVISRSLAFL